MQVQADPEIPVKIPWLSRNTIQAYDWVGGQDGKFMISPCIKMRQSPEAWLSPESV